MAVEQKKSAFDKANDKSEPRVNNNAEIEDKASEEKLSEDELDAVSGGSIFVDNIRSIDNTRKSSTGFKGDKLGDNFAI